MDKHYVIWSKQSPKCWMDGLPVGNGRLAAMVWGEKEDIISLNHEYLWRGVTRDRDVDKVPAEALKHIRDLIDREKIFKATALANVWLGGEGAGCSELPNRIDPYQPAGDLRFSPAEFSKCSRRELNMKTATARIERENGIEFICYTDVNADVIVCRWSAENSFGGKLYYTRPEDDGATEKCLYTDSNIFYECSFAEGICYKTAVSFKSDGNIIPTECGVEIEGAKEILVIIDIAVFCDAVMGEYPQIKDYDFFVGHAQHEKEFMSEHEKFILDIKTSTEDLPIEERVQRLKNGEKDDVLMLIFYNFGRYLFLTSNICAQLPANLQGKWNYEVDAPWGSDYHLNINLQMNYWMAEPMGMGKYAENMLNFIESCVPHARKAAMDMYGCRGVWFPLNTDVWARTTSESFSCSVWVGGASWLAQHYWLRYIYSGDTDFLKNRAYPFFCEVASFYEDYLVKDNEGLYQIYPSQSPENSVQGTGCFAVSIGKSSAMDVQLAFDALGYAISAANILGVDNDKVAVWEDMRSHLPEFKIGSDGRLLEWNKEYEEKDPGHRHLSHLYGLYPSDIFDPNTRPAQYAAVRKSLEHRIANGGGRIGWSQAWAACLYARFGEGDLSYKLIEGLIRDCTSASLLDIYPPKIFQIDANFGATTAITECLAQYRGEKLYILFALPESWMEGKIVGLRVPGGHVINFEWENGKVKEFEIIIGFGKQLTVNILGEDMIFEGQCGERIIKKW